MKAVKAKQLREWLAKVPDDAILLLPAPDHSYRPAKFTKGTVLVTDAGYISEDHGELTPEGPEYGFRREAVIVQ
jgi:hypothetical protein